MITGKQIREMRKEQKLTLPEVQNKSGVNAATISLIERGITHNAGIENIEAIANVLGHTLVFQPINPVHIAEREVRPTQGTTITLRELMLD